MTNFSNAPAPKHVPVRFTEAEQERIQALQDHFEANEKELSKIGVDKKEMLAAFDEATGILIVKSPVPDQFTTYEKTNNCYTYFGQSHSYPIV